MAPPVSKAATDSSQPETNALPPEPRRDFSRREVDQAGERQRQPINAGLGTGQNKKKEQYVHRPLREKGNGSGKDGAQRRLSREGPPFLFRKEAPSVAG